MKVKSNYKGRVYEYEYPAEKYSYRNIKFKDPEIYPTFSQICRDKGTSASHEINKAVEIAVKKNLTLSEVMHG